MDREVENLRIVWEIAGEHTKKLGGCVRTAANHRAAYARETSLPLEIFFGAAQDDSLSQKRECLLAMACFGEIYRMLGLAGEIGCSRFSRRLANAKVSEKPEKEKEGPARQEKSAHKE